VTEERITVVEGVDREALVRYAGASGDYNRIHWDPDAAREAGFDTVIVQGMLTMSRVAVALGEQLERPTDLRSLRVRFRREVYPDEPLRVRATVHESHSDAVELSVSADVVRDDEVVPVLTDGIARIASGGAHDR
jgi:acyl dehydratase